VAEPPGRHSQAEPGNEIDEIMRTFKDLCSFVPKKCINKNVLYSIIYKTTTLVDVCEFIIRIVLYVCSSAFRRNLN